MGVSQATLRAQARLIQNTTWRCGKLEKAIVRHLYKYQKSFGRTEVSVRDIMVSLNITREKKDEWLGALGRLEKRNIVKITTL